MWYEKLIFSTKLMYDSNVVRVTYFFGTLLNPRKGINFYKMV